MRNFLLTAAAAAALAFSSSGAFAVGGGNLAPEASPYAVLAPQTLDGPGFGRAPYEGRAAFVGEQAAPAAVPHRESRKHHPYAR